MSMYNILYGSVGVYFDYGTPEEVPVVTLREGDFFNVISFLESRPRNTTAVALEPTIVSEITYDNFSAYFREKPAKIMSLLQHMSARMRQMQKAYVDTCHALELCGDKEKLAAYRRFLTLGGSMAPIEELKVAGVDMSTPQPVCDALDYFAELIMQYQNLLNDEG